MQQLNLYTFGSPYVEIDNKPRRINQDKSLAILTYLVVENRPARRRALANQFWPDANDPMVNLRAELKKINDLLPDVFETTDKAIVRLNIARWNFWCDAVEFVQLLEACASHPHQNPDACHTCFNHRQRALGLYQADFLSGFVLPDAMEFDRWQRDHAEILRQQIHRTFEEVIAYHQARNENSIALSKARRWVTFDSLNEKAQYRLIQLLYHNSQNNAALRQYRKFVQDLKSEIGIDALISDELESLIHEISQHKNNSPVSEKIVATPAAGKTLGKVTLYKVGTPIEKCPERFIGRSETIERVNTSIVKRKPVHISGMPGVGKTAIASFIATQQMEKLSTAVLVIEVGYVEASTIFRAILKEYIASITTSSQKELQDHVNKILRDDAPVVVIDDVWIESEAHRTSFQELLLAIPDNLVLIITSRSSVLPVDTGSFYPVNLENLSASEAIDLLSHHAQQDYGSDADANQMCHSFGNNAFCIELAGKQLFYHKYLTPTRLMSKLDHSPHRINAPARFQQLGRSSFSDIISTSIEELQASSYELFTYWGLLSVSTATALFLESLLEVAHQARTEVSAHIDPIDDLEISGLVRVDYISDDCPYVAMHDVCHSYARELARKSNVDDAILGKATRNFFRKHHNNYELIDFEKQNIAYALLKTPDTHILIEVVKRIFVDGYFDTRGYDELLVQCLDRAIKLAEENSPLYDETLHYLFSKRGDIYYIHEDKFASGMSSYHNALQLAPTPSRESLLLSIIGTIVDREGKESGEVYFEEAFHIAQLNNDIAMMARILEDRGACAIFRGQFEKAHNTLTTALDYANQSGDVQRIFLTSYNLAIADVELGNFATAKETFTKGRDYATKHDHKYWLAISLSGLARVEHGCGNTSAAQGLLDESLRLSRSFNSLTQVQWIEQFCRKYNYECII